MLMCLNLIKISVSQSEKTASRDSNIKKARKRSINNSKKFTDSVFRSIDVLKVIKASRKALSTALQHNSASQLIRAQTRVIIASANSLIQRLTKTSESSSKLMLLCKSNQSLKEFRQAISKFKSQKQLN